MKPRTDTVFLSVLMSTALLSACLDEPAQPDVVSAPAESALDILHEPIGAAVLHEGPGFVDVGNATSLDDGVRSSIATTSATWQGTVQLSSNVSALSVVPQSTLLPNTGVPASLDGQQIGPDTWRFDTRFPTDTLIVSVYQDDLLVGTLFPANGDISLRGVRCCRKKRVKWRTPVRYNGGLIEQICRFEIESDDGFTVTQNELELDGNRVEYAEAAWHEYYEEVTAMEIRSDGDFTLEDESF